MPKVQLTGRLAALVGIGAAVSTATLVAFATPAFAADSAKTANCTDKVNIRKEPNATAPVIGSCSAGEKVTTDDTQGGYTHLTSKDGWVSSQYIKGADSSDGDDNDGDNRDNRDNDRDDDGGHHHHSRGGSGGGSGGGLGGVL